MTKNDMPVSNQKLLESWDRYRATPTEENTAAFLDELAAARFLVPINRAGHDGKGEGNGEAIRFLILVTQDRGNFLPAFTDLNEWEKWPFEKEEAAVVSYLDIIKIITDDPQRLTGLSINPFGQNLALSRDELALTESRRAYAARGKDLSVRILAKGDKRDTVYLKRETRLS